jgi:RNA polymerase sigma factor (sigma-70 family)
MAAPDDFAEVLEQAQAGDVRALNRLLTTIQPWIEHAAHGFADPDRPDGSTADIVQEAWLRAWQNLEEVRAATPARFRTWLEQIVHNVGLNARRHGRAQKRRPSNGFAVLDSAAGVDPGPSPSHRAATAEEVDRLRQATTALPDPTDREVLRLRFDEGMSLRQIAIRLGENHERTRQRFNAALAFLEGRLAK